MKKISLLLFALIMALAAIAQKKGNAKEIPPQVINDFKARFPSATKVKWEKDKEIIEAEFTNEGNKMEIEYLNNTWKKTEWMLKTDYTPEKIKEYIKQFYALYKIKEVAFTDNNMGERLYEVEIAKKKKERIVLIFDISSNFLRLGN